METTRKRKSRWGKGQSHKSGRKVGRPRKRAPPRPRNAPNDSRESVQPVPVTEQMTVDDDSDWEGETSHPSLPDAQILFPNHEPTAAFFGVTVADESHPSAETDHALQPARNATLPGSDDNNMDVDVTDTNASNMHVDEHPMVLTSTVNDFDLSRNCCNNCRREKTQPVSISIPQHTVKLKRVKLNKGSFRRKFANVSWVNVLDALEKSKTPKQIKTIRDNGRVTLTSCSDCEHCLSTDCKSNEAKHIWPAMVWAWLTDPGLLHEHGDQLWALVPNLWRPWWIKQLQKSKPAYSSITLDEPHSVFADRTLEIVEMRKAINDNTLAGLRDACNKHMKPLVKCPWGCTDMPCKCSERPFDIVVRRILGHNVQTCTHDPRKAMREVVGIEQGCLHQSNISLLLKNPAWIVQPSVAFSEKDGAPVVLACSAHENGCTGRYMHPPRNPNGTLPAKTSDQLTPAVCRPRSIKSVKAHHFSHSYHMHQMEGQHNGVDTVRTCTNHDFQTESAIVRKNESLSLKGRKDMKRSLDDWCENAKILPPKVGQKMLEHAEEDFPNEELLCQQCENATCITFSDALKLHCLSKACQGRIVSCAAGKKENTQQRRTALRYVPPWPSSIVHVHPHNGHGSDYPLVPAMVDEQFDCRLAWCLVGMHACLPTLWEASDSVVSRDDDWTGWLLSHVTKTCYPERVRSVHGSSHSNPLQFRYKKTKSAGDLLFELLVKLGVRCVENECDSTNVAPLSANASTQHLNEDNGNNDEIDDESDDDSLGELERCFEIVNDNNENDDADGEEIENDVEAVVNYEGLHADGNYHCKDIATLFSKHKSVKTIHHSDFPAALSDMNCGVDCLIVYRDNNCDGSSRDGMPQTSGSEREREWELRFVACANAGRGNSNRSIFCRHGSQSFPQWWKQEQKHKDIRQMKLSDGLPTEATCNFDVAVYVRKKKCHWTNAEISS